MPVKLAEGDAPNYRSERFAGLGLSTVGGMAGAEHLRGGPAAREATRLADPLKATLQMEKNQLQHGIDEVHRMAKRLGVTPSEMEPFIQKAKDAGKWDQFIANAEKKIKTVEGPAVRHGKRMRNLGKVGLGIGALYGGKKLYDYVTREKEAGIRDVVYPTGGAIGGAIAGGTPGAVIGGGLGGAHEAYKKYKEYKDFSPSFLQQLIGIDAESQREDKLLDLVEDFAQDAPKSIGRGAAIGGGAGAALGGTLGFLSGRDKAEAVGARSEANRAIRAALRKGDLSLKDLGANLDLNKMQQS